MKTLLTLLAFVGFISASNAQALASADIPSTVQKAFAKANPKISNAEWRQTGDLYAVYFMENNLERSYTYTSNGKLEQKEEQVTLGQLPTETLKYLNDNHPDGTVKKIRKVMKPTGKTVYLVNIKDLELIFDSAGKYQGSSN